MWRCYTFSVYLPNIQARRGARIFDRGSIYLRLPIGPVTATPENFETWMFWNAISCILGLKILLKQSPKQCRNVIEKRWKHIYFTNVGLRFISTFSKNNYASQLYYKNRFTDVNYCLMTVIRHRITCPCVLLYEILLATGLYENKDSNEHIIKTNDFVLLW